MDDPYIDNTTERSMDEQTRKALELAREAIQDGFSVCQSVCMDRSRRVMRDDCAFYLQTEEWCKWVKDDVGTSVVSAIAAIDAALSAHETPVANAGWMKSGALLYRLTDDRKPVNRDEIRVTMADGSRTDEACSRRAGELFDRLTAAPAAPVAIDAERDQLRAEVEALRADAERYRWLRSVPSGFEAQRIVNDTPHGMDASIDKARKQQ
jgi:hypothetical protein